MTFETVLIPTLLRAHLAIEFELLETFGLHAVGNVLRGSLLCFRHGFGFGFVSVHSLRYATFDDQIYERMNQSITTHNTLQS